MSDELAIQPQIIEPRKKDNSLAYGTVGALAGAGAGWATNKYLLNGAKNLSDLAADASSKDKVELSSKYKEVEEATIGDLKAKADALKEAENKLAEASKAGLPDNAKEVQEFNKAKADYEAAYQKAYDAEIAKHKPAGKGGKIDVHKWAELKIDPTQGEFDITGLDPDADKAKIKEANDKLHDALKDKKYNIQGKNGKVSLAEQYRADYKALMDARAAVDAKLATIASDRAAMTSKYDQEIMKLVFGGVPNDAAGNPVATFEDLSATEFKQLLEKTEPVDGKLKKIFRSDRLGKLANALAESSLPEITSTTAMNETILKELGATEGTPPSGTGYKVFTVERTTKGVKHNVTFYMKKNEFDSAVKKYNKNLPNLRKDMAGRVVHGFRHRVADAQANLLKESNIIERIIESKGKKGITEAEINLLKGEGLIVSGDRIIGIDRAKAGVNNPNPFPSDSPLNKAKNKLRRMYLKEQAEFDARMARAYEGVPKFEQYDKQVTEAYTDKELAEINKKFDERYSKLVEGGKSLKEEVAETTAEISEEAKNKAKAKAESEAKGLKETMEAKEKALNEAKASKGTVDEAAKKAAEEAKTKAKTEFDNAVKNITEKYGKGKWKIAAPVIGAIALGAAGWLAGHSDEA